MMFAIRNIVVIFDGTGPVDDSKYNDVFKTSFCRTLHDTISMSYYTRGVPGEEGKIWQTIKPMWDDSIPDKVQHGKTVIDDIFKKNGPTPKIYLIGHSRGGLCCVQLAKKLFANNIDVEAMFLFDAVDMTFKSNCDVPNKYALAMPFISQLEASKYLACRVSEDRSGEYSRIIPSNVRHVYHAMRDPAFANQFVVDVARLTNLIFKNHATPGADVGPEQRAKIAGLKAEHKIAVDRLNRTRSNPMDRKYNWGNCATATASPSTKMTTRLFMGSHGAIGGCPWEKEVFKDDAECKKLVGNWMWPFIKQHGILDKDASFTQIILPGSEVQHNWTNQV